MSVDTPSTQQDRVSIEDIKHRAHDVKSKAVAEAKGAADVVLGGEEGKRTLLFMAGVVVLAASIAFYLGTRSGRAQVTEQFLGE
jgi:hypothetical protein